MTKGRSRGGGGGREVSGGGGGGGGEGWTEENKEPKIHLVTHKNSQLNIKLLCNFQKKKEN